MNDKQRFRRVDSSSLVIKKCILKLQCRDFPGSPVVKTSPSSAGCADWIPGLGAKIPHAGQPKKKIKTNNTVTNSIKNLKIKPPMQYLYVLSRMSKN